MADSKQRRRPSLDDVEQIAKETWARHFAGRRVPGPWARRLSHSIGIPREQGVPTYFVEIVLHREGDCPEGLLRDLDGPQPEVLVTIQVDAVTGEAVLIENRPLPWEAQDAPAASSGGTA